VNPAGGAVVDGRRETGGRCRLYNDFIAPSAIRLPPSTFSTFLTRHTALTPQRRLLSTLTEPRVGSSLS
jgi:hypothetical protein